MNLDDIGKVAEYFLHGDVYRDRLFRVQRISTTYIALNESVEPLGDVRVRKALQLALNRLILLDAAYSGRGMLENGIMPAPAFTALIRSFPKSRMPRKRQRSCSARRAFPTALI
jgi:ABC-type dipeptide transport system, periplasmic component